MSCQVIFELCSERIWCRCIVVKYADSQHRGCQLDSSMCHFKKTLLMRKASGNHLMNSTSLEKLRALSLVSATLKMEYATQFFCE